MSINQSCRPLETLHKQSRGIKDTDTALKPFLGFIFSGYRDLRDYHQRVGSPLVDIAEVSWLAPLADSEISELVACRVQNEQAPTLPEKGIAFICEWAGGHPYLTQQMLNYLFDYFFQNKQFPRIEDSVDDLIEDHDNDFSRWWNSDRKPGGFSNDERTVYLKLVDSQQGTDRTLSQLTNLSRQSMSDALEVLLRTGIIRRTDNKKEFRVGSRLFEEWLARQNQSELGDHDVI